MGPNSTYDLGQLLSPKDETSLVTHPDSYIKTVLCRGRENTNSLQIAPVYGFLIVESLDSL